MRVSTALAGMALLASASAQVALERRCRICPDIVPECSGSCPVSGDVCITVPQSCEACAKTTCLAPSDISKVAGPTVYPSIPSFTPLPPGSTAPISSFSVMPLPPGVTPAPIGGYSTTTTTQGSVQPGGPMSPVSGNGTASNTSGSGGVTTSSPATTGAAAGASTAATSVSPNAAPLVTPFDLGVAMLVGLGALV